MSAQDKKVFKAVAYSAGGALLVHLVAFLFFAALMEAGYFNPPPPKEEAEQFEITFVEDEVGEPEVEPAAATELAMLDKQEEQKPPSAFFNTDGLNDEKTPNENAPFFSDKNTKAASEAPPEDNSTIPMPTITEGVERDLPSKDLFKQDYTEGPGTVPMPDMVPTPPNPAMAEPEPAVVEAPPAPKPEVLPEPQPEPEPVKPVETVAVEKPPAPPEPVPEIVKVEPLVTVAPPAPVMPEATLPPVPELTDVPEPEEKLPDPAALVAAEKPQPKEPARAPEPEIADPAPSTPSLDPTLNPGGYQPDPAVVALLDMTPKEAPEPRPKPQVQETPPEPGTAEESKAPDIESLLDRQRRRASSTSGYKAERTPTRLKGGVSNKGPNSVDAEGTPQGRYQAAVSAAVERTWYSYTKRDADKFRIGTAKVRFAIAKNGKVGRIQVIENTSNETFANNCFRAVNDTKYAAIPDELDYLLYDGAMEVEYTFSIY